MTEVQEIMHVAAYILIGLLFTIWMELEIKFRNRDPFDVGVRSVALIVAWPVYCLFPLIIITATGVGRLVNWLMVKITGGGRD